MFHVEHRYSRLMKAGVLIPLHRWNLCTILLHKLCAPERLQTPPELIKDKTTHMTPDKIRMGLATTPSLGMAEVVAKWVQEALIFLTLTYNIWLINKSIINQKRLL